MCTFSLSPLAATCFVQTSVTKGNSTCAFRYWILRFVIFVSCLIPAGNYMFKVNNRNTKKRCEICSKLPIKASERRQWRRSGVFIVNFKLISHLFSSVSIVNLEQVYTGWNPIVNCQWRHSGVFIVNFEHISNLVLVFLLLTLSR